MRQLILGILGTIYCMGTYSAVVAVPTKLLPKEPASKVWQPTGKSYTGDRILAVTVPKCGTFMLLKCLTLLGVPTLYKEIGIPKQDIDYIRKHNQLLPPNHYKGRYHMPTAGPVPHWWIQRVMAKAPHRFSWTHVSHTPEFEQYIDENSKAMLMIIRDPRDMLVSFAHMVQTNKRNPADTIALEPLLLDLIDGRQKNYITWATEIHDAYPVIWEMGICAYYRQFLPFINCKKCLTIRFEELVGTLGGGTDAAQCATIKRIAKHVGRPISDDKVATVAAQLFGNSATFREGKIGSWVQYFTPQVKAAFKATPGATELLIELGYEKDNSW